MQPETEPNNQIAKIKALWPTDPRAAFEEAIGQENTDTLFPWHIADRLLEAGVLPFHKASPALEARPAVQDFLEANAVIGFPGTSTLWHFFFEGHGWLDAWALNCRLRHEEYTVMLLLGLGAPLDRIAAAMNTIGGPSAWHALGAAGWIQMYARMYADQDEGGRIHLGKRSWRDEMPGLQEVAAGPRHIPQYEAARDFAPGAPTDTRFWRTWGKRWAAAIGDVAKGSVLQQVCDMTNASREEATARMNEELAKVMS